MTNYLKLSSFTFDNADKDVILRFCIEGETKKDIVVNNEKKEIKISLVDDSKKQIIKACQLIDRREIADSFSLLIDEEIDYAFLIENLLLALTDVKVLRSSWVKPIEYSVYAKQDIINFYPEAFANANAYNTTRILNHLPHSLCSVESLTNSITQIINNDKVEVSILRKKNCEELKLNGILAVTKGSLNEPSVVKLTYKTNDQAPIGLVGKGVMYDTGGYNLKTGDFSSMKTDMAGAGAVIGCIKNIADKQLDVNVTAYLMLAENLINQSAVLPGDVIEYNNGTTVEIVNTDAEGRLILAEGLLLAQKEGCSSVLDIATLTGNSAAALGKGYAPLYSNNNEYIKLFLQYNEHLSDKVWNMPLADEYISSLCGEIADIRNVSLSKHAGSVTAALFLQHFILETTNWVHIDMGAMSRKEEFGVKVNGYGVRLLVNAIERILI